MKCSRKSRLVCITVGLLLGLFLAMGCTSLNSYSGPCQQPSQLEVVVHAFGDTGPHQAVLDRLQQRGIRIVYHGNVAIGRPRAQCGGSPHYVVTRSGEEVVRTDDLNVLIAVLRWTSPLLSA